MATLATVLLLSGCSQTVPAPAPNSSGQPPAPTAPVSVKTAPVQRGRLSTTLTYSGNIQARRQVALLPKVGGRVMKLMVDVGSAVKEGDVLLELDKDAVAAQVAQAESGLA
ncbi:MAG: biotin/lipoyl-binding protein, partial [Dehalococcoidia bacterium]|nr:biotin/lipoyl-binding protein [Dehalococcoidia bacterium]